jgi:Kef-type K+ transport system membrane component KefB
LIGLVADIVGRHTPLPRVTLLLLSGILVGASGFDLIPREFVDQWFPPLTLFALTMVGFLLGQQLTVAKLKERGRTVAILSVGKVLCAALAVASVLILAGVDVPLALVLAGIAPATAPAATLDVVKEAGTRSEFSKLLLNIVAFDDALGLILFSLLIALAAAAAGLANSGGVFDGLIEVGGSLLFGAAIGIPMAYLTGRIRSGDPMQAEAFGFVLVCAGGADLLGLSPILAAMVMGSIVGSLATHHERPFHEIELIEWPFMILFFILAGASLNMNAGFAFGWLVLLYILARGVGISLGVSLTSATLKLNPRIGRWLGLALFPQAGVALGMALIASQRFPAYSDVILGTVLMSTVILEVASPVMTRVALRRMENVAIRS